MEAIERKEYEVQKRLCDDRFKRDKESIAQTADQETRIRALENKGGIWLDRIISLALGALIAFLASLVF